MRESGPAVASDDSNETSASPDEPQIVLPMDTALNPETNLSSYGMAWRIQDYRGTLMLSHHRGLASLGLCLTLGVTCCMLTALVFLPAVLRLLSIHRLAKEKPIRAATPVEEERRLAA